MVYFEWNRRFSTVYGCDTIEKNEARCKMMHLCDMNVQELIRSEGHACACGRHHGIGLKYLRIGSGVTEKLPEALRVLGCKKPFIVCDQDTKKAAWHFVQPVLEKAGIAFALYTIHRPHPEPDEETVGEITMAFDPACDCILALGSGVINDCCKVLAKAVGKPQLVVGTAPSMDGYASDSSSMIVGRAKTTLYNACPQVILADTRIMKDAPLRMLQAGLGDMLAKYIAMCEWRMTALINGEYYCEEIAGMMRASLRKIVSSASRMMEREEEAIADVAEGLILSGIAMAFAKISRPASGLEHYFSHLWEMFSLDRGLPAELHGIQVGVGTLLCLKIYDKLKGMTPDAGTFAAARAAWKEEEWEKEMHRVFGRTAQGLIEKERTQWHNNDTAARQRRFEKIQACWPQLQQIMAEELPPLSDIALLMREAGMPMQPDELGWKWQDVLDAFFYSRNTRDKYLTSSLLWDMGELKAEMLL